METVKFSSIRLKDSNKKGMPQVDADGYRTQIVGGLEIFNSNGDFYTLQGAKDLFEKSSEFMRRIQRGALRGENGHPKYVDGMTMDAYINRMMIIDEDQVCAHFSDIWLDFDSVKSPNGSAVVAIMAKIKPSGKLGYLLESAFNNPKENVCFSIRATTRDYMVRGIKNRRIVNIITFDYVNEPGIAIAEKYLTPTLESLDEKIVTKDAFVRAVSNRPTSTGMAIESSNEIANGLLCAMGWNLPAGVSAAYTNWK